MHKALGIHVFAGGFTMGVKRVCEVDTHLETHGFGLDTAREVVGVETINEEGAKWPDVTDAEWCFGNPRCTGFSCVTAGHGEDTHGPWAKQTRDIHELCEYAAGRYDCVVWESVQQAFSTGRPLLDYLRDEIFAPKGYRIAHLMLNAASFGNSQQRKRYFFVAYRDDRNFNVVPPDVSPVKPVLYDAVWQDRGRDTREVHLGKTSDYDRDCYARLTDQEKDVVPRLPNGWGLNFLAHQAPWDLPDRMFWKWRHRTSEMPFSMHCVFRLGWNVPAPTLFSSAHRLIHPDLDRPMTVGELSRVMGWGDVIPRGPMPVPQIVKGIVPECGEWLARQVVAYLEDAWGAEDWESSYDPNSCEWVGRDCDGAREKVFDMTKYVGQRHEDRPGARIAHHYNQDRRGSLIRPWTEIEALRRDHGVLNPERSLSRGRPEPAGAR